uniref:Mitochondria-eating protein C-terminal domain-containing protein n=1 Tax=Magallana gigas TaxID=29159 RepID=K1RBQ4_MAGGI
MLSSEDKRTFANKLQRLKGDLEYFIWRIETSSSDVTETDKTRYCRLIIEIMEFVVKRIENKLRESQITKGQYSLQLDELKLKISKLEEELDKERTKSKTNTLPFWQNMTKTNTPRKLIDNEKQKPSKREVELESEKEKLKTQIQEQKHCIQNLEIERKNLYDRLSKLSFSNTASKDETEEALEPFPPVLPSMATRYSDLFVNGWTTAYKTLTSVVMSDHKVTQLLLQCLTICRDKIPLLGSYPPEVAKYADDCVDLCWSMVIQSPLFHLSWASPHGEMVDTSKYTFYRTSGHYVDYVVWPVLLDCEGGTVVSKGVVQGRN